MKVIYLKEKIRPKIFIEINGTFFSTMSPERQEKTKQNDCNLLEIAAANKCINYRH